MRSRLQAGWPHLLIEAGGAALVLFAASAYATLIFHPQSALASALPTPTAQRALMGLAMGATIAAFTYSPIGQRSGAHLNPAVTLAFLRLRRVPPATAAAYIAAQVVGAILGIGVASLALGGLLAHPEVHYVTTRPGPQGSIVATVAEGLISMTMMGVVLAAVGSQRFMRHAGAFSASLVALFITFESPVSGASLNPARSFGSAVGGSEFATLWVYIAGPTLGMLLAAELYRRLGKEVTVVGSAVGCAKLAHDGRPCHFCEYRWERARQASSRAMSGNSSHPRLVIAGARSDAIPTPRRSE